MPRLRDRYKHPPGGFQMLLPETGQSTPFTGSFNYVCEQTLMLIQANLWLAERHGWPVNLPGVEAMVEAYNVQRCVAGGWTDWLIMDDPTPAVASYLTPAVQKKTLSVVGAVRNVAAGVGVLLDWLGSGAKPVDSVLAESRASICLVCPKNGKGGITSYFTEPAAEKIRIQLEMKNGFQIRTSQEEQLGVCEACLCPLKLKVWTPMEHILLHTSEEVRKELHPSCWILKGT